MKQIEAFNAKAEQNGETPLEPPSILVIGERPSDGKTFTLALTIAVEDFRPTGEHGVMVQGDLIEGKLGFLNPKAMKMVSGLATLSAASTVDGETVAGEVSVEFALMRGGEPTKMAWK